jgi:dATP pyrophosphohydrolase
MPRAPFQVLVYPYRRVSGDEFEFALLKRMDTGYWQAIAGGGEDAETPLDAARREAAEEAGLPFNSEFIQLDTIESIPVTEFHDSQLWGEEVFVIPQYCFGVLVTEGSIGLSQEHSEYQWLAYQEAYDLVQFDGNRTALWELNKRLHGKGPRVQGE